MTISFFVPGHPKTAGSKRHVGRGIIVDSSGAKGREWRALVQDRCREALQFSEKPAIAFGPVRLGVVFVLPRINAHYRGKEHKMRDDAPYHHATRPDTTKLLRAVEDSLTGIAWRDDAQVAVQEAWKVYGDEPGAFIRIEALPARGAMAHVPPEAVLIPSVLDLGGGMA